MESLVSIIIPVYNAESTIIRCIDSIAKQTYTNIEIIVINDGSNDNTLDLLYEYKKRKDKIKIVNINNSGVSVARNTGLKIAKGKYIIFVDSDDCIKDNMVEKLVEMREKYNTFIICNYCILKKTKKYATDSKEYNIDYGISFQSDEDFCKLFIEMDILKAPWGKIYDADIIRKNNLIFETDISLGEDLIFNLNYLKFIERIIYLKDKLYCYYVGNSNSLSKKYYDNMIDIQKKIVERIIQHIAQIKNCKQIDEVYRNCLKMLMSAVTNELHKKTNIVDKYIQAKRRFADNIIQEYADFLYDKNMIEEKVFNIIKHKKLLAYLLIKNKL